MLLLQFAVLPPPEPTQVQDQGPEPFTAEAVPCPQRLLLGADGVLPPLAAPQAPLMMVVTLAEQLAVEPPLLPVQVQDQGPDPLTEDALPALQRFAGGGALAIDVPLAEPQTPSTDGVFVAEQLAVEPPLLPVQVQAQGPLLGPCTLLAVPVLQRFPLGADGKIPLFEEPQTPFTGVLYAWQLAEPPPLEPLQVQVQELPLATADAVPLLQREEDGAVADVMPLAEPQAPVTGDGQSS